jgi:hypothetical protein
MSRRRSVQPDTQTVEKIRGLVAECGVTRAAKQLDISPQTVVRLLSGLTVDIETLRIARGDATPAATEGQSSDE